MTARETTTSRRGLAVRVELGFAFAKMGLLSVKEVVLGLSALDIKGVTVGMLLRRQHAMVKLAHD